MSISTSISTASHLESVESFRGRAREWIAENLAPASNPTDQGPEAAEGDRDEAEWMHARKRQARLHAGGFAGICYPKEYGGLGLTPAHQRAFNEEVTGYEMPTLLNIPTFTICCPTILDMGSE
jgi:alkylation response protein AidB-like acyl-CoA dehydrogenase